MWEGLANKTLGEKQQHLNTTNHGATQPAAWENKAWPERWHLHDATGRKMVTGPMVYLPDDAEWRMLETTTPCCGSTRLAQYGTAPGGDQSPQGRHSSVSLRVWGKK